MNDYMRALHRRFFREPDVSELEEDIENTRQEVRDCLDKMQRRRLMHLVDCAESAERRDLPGQLHRRVQTGLGAEQGAGGGRPVLLR